MLLLAPLLIDEIQQLRRGACIAQGAMVVVERNPIYFAKLPQSVGLVSRIAPTHPGMLFNDAAELNFPRKMPADAWFGFKGCDRFEIEEQSFGLPDDEVLTILKLPDEAVA